MQQLKADIFVSNVVFPISFIQFTVVKCLLCKPYFVIQLQHQLITQFAFFKFPSV